jgi:hypothetical protein
LEFSIFAPVVVLVVQFFDFLLKIKKTSCFWTGGGQTRYLGVRPKLAREGQSPDTC